MAELEQDPAYRERQAALEAEDEQQKARLAKAEKPLLADLAAIGIRTDSAWNLYQDPGSLPEAIPVLLDHLEREYPDKVLEGIANALDDRSARDSWHQIKTIYLSTVKATVRDRLAAVMAGIAVRAHYDDLLWFLTQESLGETRIYFLVRCTASGIAWPRARVAG
ncbi:hypothetical protein V6K52_07150 [Knoellia sp. S7-12]|uniref:hypothetical protein n=1 Tax=Knoellia sp. S7-12 TaxID=3126698 RepID=UPI003366A786